MWLRIFSLTLAMTAIAAGQTPAPPDSTNNIATTTESILRDETTWQEGSTKFVPVTAEKLKAQRRRGQSIDTRESSVRSLRVFATLVDSVSLQGRFALELDPIEDSAQPDSSRTICLGRTNLENLKLFSHEQPVSIAYDESGSVIPLAALETSVINGTWKKKGTGSGTSTIFQLELPAAAVCEFELKTDSNVVVTSPNSLVVSRRTASARTTWKIRPDKSSLLTISCSRRTRSPQTAESGVSISADIEAAVNQIRLAWAVTTGAAFVSQTLNFQFSETCTVTEVIFPPSIGGTWNAGKDGLTLTVKLPPSEQNTLIRIKAVAPNRNPEEIALPFLTPSTATFAKGATPTAIAIRSSNLQVSILPPLLLTNVDLNGAYEGDMAYSADGTQTLNLTQFSKTAYATFSVTRARPVIHDSTVVLLDPLNQPGKATVYVSLEARSGTLGQAEWTIPSPWRVTEVKEVGTEFPLLFRVKSSTKASDQTILNTYLRTPVTSAGRQALQVTLQSTATGPGYRFEPPALISDTYYRVFDAIATHEENINLGVPSAMTANELTNLATWLPEADFDGTVSLERSSRKLSSEKTRITGEEMFATIDYSATKDGEVVRESIRIRLRRRGGIPLRIPISVTPGVNISVSDESSTSLKPILTRSGNPSENWLLQLPVTTSPPDELNIILTASRKIQQQMPATVIAVKNAQQSGGSIRPPTSDEGLELELPEFESPIRKTISYPESPPREMTLIQSQGDPSSQQVSGIVFRILNRTVNDEIEIESAVRLQVGAANSHPFLKLRLPDTYDVSTFVNGRRSFAETTNELIVVPLDSTVSTNTVDLLFRSKSRQPLAKPVVISPVTASESDSQQILSFSLLPPGIELVAGESTGNADQREPESVRNLLTSTFEAPNSPALAAHMNAFVSRWNTAALGASAVLNISSAFQDDFPVRLRDSRFDTSTTIMYAVCGMFLWRLFSSVMRLKLWFLASCLLLMTGVAVTVPTLDAPWLNGLLLGSGCYSLLCAAARTVEVGRTEHRKTPRNRTAVAAAVVLLTLGASSVSAKEMTGQRNNDGSSTIKETDASPLRNKALVVTSNLKVHFESTQSSRVKIRCVVATRPGNTSTLVLPLRNVTLVDCAVDGVPVLPQRNTNNGIQIAIQSEALIPDQQIPGAANGPDAVGPSVLDGWLLRSVEYTVRIVPRGTNEAYRIAIPYPPSPEMQLQLIDSQERINAAGFLRQTPIDVGANGVRSFPTVYSRDAIELYLEMRASQEDAASVQQSEVTCEAEVSPQVIRLTTRYVITPAGEAVDYVSVDLEPRYRINSVESAVGEPLLWSTDGNELVVRLSPNSQGTQEFTIRQFADLPLNLSQQVYLDRICTINGLRSDRSELLVKTTDRFFVDSISLQKDPAKSAAAKSTSESTPAHGDPGVSQGIAADVSFATIRLVHREANREAYLQQSAVVQESTVQWTCLCRLDVSGRPVYRQEIYVPADVRIGNVTATSNGVSRLQAWTRTDDSIVVALREPTRGSVEFELDGTLLRVDDADTALPAVSLPDAQILEYGLEISADPQTDAYIRDLGSAVPSVAIDISKEGIPIKPLRLSIRDESKPVVIRARPEQKLSMEAAVLIYEIGGQPLLAQCLALQTVDATFDIRFRLRNDGYPNVNPRAARGDEVFDVTAKGDEFVISRASKSDRALPTMLVIPDLIPPDGQRIHPVSLPDFDAEIEVTSHRVFDLRNHADSRPNQSLPDWLSTAVVGTGVTDVTMAAVASNYRFDTTDNRFQIEPIQDTITKAVNRKRVIGATGTHTVQAFDGYLGAGQSDFLVFCSDVNSIIPIAIPVQIVASEIRLNGEVQTIDSVDGIFEITAPDRINHVSVIWASSTKTNLNSLTLPKISATGSNAFAIVAPPREKPLFWSIDGDKLSRSDFERQIFASFNRAVRSVNPGFRSGEDIPKTQAAFGLESPFWEQISRESPATSASFKAAIERAHAIISENVVLIVPSNDSICIRTTKRPSYIHGFAFLTGIALMLGSFMHRRRRTGQHRSDAPTSGSTIDMHQESGSAANDDAV